jgi:transcription antitermination factor NusG
MLNRAASILYGAEWVIVITGPTCSDCAIPSLTTITLKRDEIHLLADDMYEPSGKLVTSEASGRSNNLRGLEREDHLLSDNGEAASEQTHSGGLISDSQREWFAAYTMSRHEKRIASHCQRIGIEQFLPLYISQRSWKNRTTVDLQMPLFPNYLFVRLAPQDHGPFMRLPGLLSTVGNAAGPVVIPDGDMELLRRIIACKTIEPHPFMAKGDRVRVVTGPLAGVLGVVQKRGNGLRFIVTLDVIGKSVSLHIEGSALELVASQANLTAEHRNAVA